jgi:hypothetical protein
VFSLEWSSEVIDGLPGGAVGANSKLVVDHGSISPYDLKNTLVASGPDFRSGWRDPVPVGNVDICPTVSHLLGLDSGSPMDGRVLTEALGDPPPTYNPTEEGRMFSARGRDWLQRVQLEQVGSTSYLAAGTAEIV